MNQDLRHATLWPRPRALARGAALSILGVVACTLTGSAAQLGGAILTASKTGERVIDVNNDGKTQPGDVLEYVVTVGNDPAATEQALEVVFTDTLDTNTMLIEDSILVTPIAFDDMYLAQQDTVFAENNPALGLLANDVDPDDATGLTVQTPGTFPTTGGNQIMIGANGEIMFMPMPAFSGFDTFTYFALDSDGLPSNEPATVTIDVNGTPDAIDDDFTTDEDTSITDNVLANDTDPEPDPLMVVLNADGNDVTLPSGASLVLEADGLFQYFPNGVFEELSVGGSTTDTFDYTVTDNRGGFDDATVTITMTGVNDAPIAQPVDVNLLEESGGHAFIADDIDDDDDPSSLTYMVVDLPAAGTVVNQNDGTFDFQQNNAFDDLPEGATAEVTFTYKATDMHGADSNVATVTVIVTGTNDAPVAQMVNGAADEDGPPVVVSFDADDVDTDDDPATLTYTILTAPTEGSVANNDNGTFSFDPGLDFQDLADGATRDVSFEYEATDSHGADSNTAIVTITVTGVNDSPFVDPIPAQMTGELTELMFTATASDIDMPANTLTFSLGTPTDSGSGIPTGASIDPDTGVFTWTPSESQGPAFYEFAVIVTDDGTPPLAFNRPIEITVNEVNADPVLDPIGNLSVDEGQLLTFTATATDADIPADTLFFSLDGTGPGGPTITPEGVFTWTPTELDGPGTLEIQVIVRDHESAHESGGEGGSDSETITITINEVNEPPVLAPVGNATPPELVEFTFTASATDPDSPANDLTFSIGETLDTGGGVPPTATIDPDTGAFSWTPDEGQGPSVYTFDVIVTDNGSPPMEDRETISLTVAEVNVAPLLDVIGNQIVDEGIELAFTATATDADIPANTLTFSLQDEPDGATIDATGNFSWTPTEDDGPGTFTFDIIVTDDGDPMLTDSETISVTVNEVNEPPVLAAIGDATIDELIEYTFTATATDPDAPTNGLSFSIADTADVGDGLPGNATIDPDTGAFSWTPGETQAPGTYTFDVIVTDDGSPPMEDRETISLMVLEVNVAPVLDPVGNQIVDEETELTFTATASDVDVPANTLTFTLLNEPAGATIDATGNFSWTPTEADGPGMFTFDVVVTDDGTPNLMDSETITVTVNEVNTAPVLAPIGELSGLEGELITFTAMATDADLPPNILTYALGPGAPDGASIDGSSGVFTWTPSETQGGAIYEVQVTVTDAPGDGLPSHTRIAQITVEETNEAPVLATVGNQMVDELTELTFTAMATDSDLPANGLTFTIAASIAPLGNFPDGAIIDPQTGVFTWTPSEAQGPNTYNLVVIVTDDGSPPEMAFEAITITVNETNEAPVLDPIGPQVADEGTELTFTAVAGDPDMPGNALTYSLDTGAPEGATIDPLTGAFTWTPSETQDGEHTITVRVTDDGDPSLDDSETIIVTVNEINVAPAINPLPSQSVDEGTELTFQATATDADVPANDLTFTLGGGAPSGATIDSDGNFSWTPTEAQGGPSSVYAIEIIVTDNGAPTESDTISVDVTVGEVNEMPTLDPIGPQSADEGAELTFTASAADVDIPSNELSFSLDGAPAGATIDSMTGVFSWTPAETDGGQTFTFDVIVTDDGNPNLSSTETVSVEVNEVNAAPVLAPIGDQSVDQFGTLTLPVTATDSDSPPNTLTFELGPGSEGDIDPVTGIYIFMPDGSGPSITVEIIVTDDGVPSMTDSETFTISIDT